LPPTGPSVTFPFWFPGPPVRVQSPEDALMDAYPIDRDTALRMVTASRQTGINFVRVRDYEPQHMGFFETSYVTVPSHHTSMSSFVPAFRTSTR
jgi:hypothetical protein